MGHKTKHLGVMMIVGAAPRTAASVFTATLLRAKVCRWSFLAVAVVVFVVVVVVGASG